MIDPTYADATALLQALAGRRMRAEDLLEAALERKAQTNGFLNAVVAEDVGAARAAARQIDHRIEAGESPEALGLLAGLPMTVKDTFDVDGLPASSGVRALLGRPAGDASVVGRARSAGAVIWGKTNVPVMAADWQSFNPVYGTTNNPFDPERTPGGSSGGAAAALAAGITALEIGSDIGGSLRVPASFCGVFAHKPTWGLVPQRGHVPPAPGAAAERDLNVVGPMARSARDLRLLFSVIALGPVPARAPPAALEGLRVAAWLEEESFILDAEVRTVIEGFLQDLQGLGARVETVRSPVPGAELMAVYRRLLSPLIVQDMTPAQRRQLQTLRPAAQLFGRGRRWAAMALEGLISHQEWQEADEKRARMGQTLRAFFARHDVIIAPSTPITAFPHAHGPFPARVLRCSDGRKIPYDCLLDWIALATALGLPATAAPVGLSPGGLPVGIQIIGPRGADSKTLAVAQAIDEALGGFRRPPLLSPAV